MSTRVAQTTTTNSSSRRAYATTSGSSNRQAGQGSRREAVHYTVERVQGTDGREQEVLTLEDTPEPPAGGAAPAAAGTSKGAAYASGSHSKQDPYAGYQPPPKKRKSDVGAGAYAAPQYAAPANYPAGPSQQQYRAPAASGTKRKADDYERNNRPVQKPKEGGPIYSDNDGHFIVNLNTIVKDSTRNHTYDIKKLLGQGTFGKVVAAVEKRPGRTERNVALKIIRAVHKYQEAAKTEIRVLDKLRQHDPNGTKKCIRLDSNFDFHGHTCLVTPLLSCSVFDYLKENAYEAFPLSHVQDFARQLLTSLKYVHDLGLIHTDLKPENILLEDNASYPDPSTRPKPRKLLYSTGIQLIDFGSATFQEDYHATVVSTRHYRAPEIILGLGWSFPCDMWSIGCILVEFVTGEALFQTHENLEHLAMMEKVFGPMPPDYAARAARSESKEAQGWIRKTASNGRSRAPPTYALQFPTAETPKSSLKFVKGMKTLHDIISKVIGTGVPAREFVSLCEGLLRWDVKERLDVRAALNHPFFSQAVRDVGSQAPPPR